MLWGSTQRVDGPSARKQLGGFFISCAGALLICTMEVALLESAEYFVAIDHPVASDLNDGRSMSQPFKTLSRGVRDLQPGDTLSIKEGVYREALVENRSGTFERPILIRAFPGDEGLVVIRGSDVVHGWTNDERDIWSVAWQPLPPLEYGPGWLDYGEYSRRREMVFIDGVPLSQVLSRSELESGRFWMDGEAGRIRIHHSGDPNNSHVEIAVRTVGVMAHGSYNVFRGLRVEHVATDLTIAAMHLGHHQRVEDCSVQHNNGNGIKAYSNTVLVRSECNHNGRVGIVLADSGSVLESNETSFNSWRYGPRWHAGGVKVIGEMPSDNRITHHTARYNHGRGVWFDTVGTGNIVEASFLEGNVVAGLQFEAAIGPNLAINNIIVGTTKDPSGDPPDNGAGIVVYEAMDTHLYNNTIVDSAGSGIVVTGGERDGFYAANTRVFNNIIVNSSNAAIRIAVREKSREESSISSHLFDFNLFYENSSTVIFPRLSTLHGLHFWSLSEWQTNSENDLNSLSAPPMFVDPSILDFALQEGSPAIDAGRELAEVVEDFMGTSRPMILRTDIGAFEFFHCPTRSASGRVQPDP